MLALVLILILIISFILAFRSLAELEVPEEAKKTIKSIRPKLSVSGIFLFFRDKVLHYPTLRQAQGEPSEGSSSGKPSSAASDSSSEGTGSGLTKV